MKKAFVALTAILVGLAVLLPFASSNPDPLDSVTSTFGTSGQTSVWEGILPDYNVSYLGNSYLSTLVAGILGLVVVVVASLLLGKALASKSSKIQNVKSQ